MIYGDVWEEIAFLEGLVKFGEIRNFNVISKLEFEVITWVLLRGGQLSGGVPIIFSFLLSLL